MSGEARQEWAEQEFMLCVYISVYKYFLVVVGKRKDELLYNSYGFMQSGSYLSVGRIVWHCVNQVGGKLNDPMIR